MPEPVSPLSPDDVEERVRILREQQSWRPDSLWRETDTPETGDGGDEHEIRIDIGGRQNDRKGPEGEVRFPTLRFK